MEIYLALVAFLAPPIIGVWVPVRYFARHNYGRLAARGEVRRALLKAAKNRRFGWILGYIQNQLALPDANLRPLLGRAAQ